MAHILIVSCDEVVLRTHRLYLQSHGYVVTPALGFKDGICQCSKGRFDVCILGDSIPYRDKEALSATFRQNCNAPLISLCGSPSTDVPTADCYADPSRKDVLRAINEVLGRQRKEA